MTELPRYQCHKVVQAGKIQQILQVDDHFELVFEGIDVRRKVSPDWIFRRGAKEGGYFVLYSDAYESFSPADTFEQGYTLLPA